MTVVEADRIIRDFYKKSNPSEEDEFLFTEALKYLIEETKNPECMTQLGGFYYDKRNFDLALKYYELAAEYDHLPAIIGLGYIWYYGRTGERDYEKAFRYYDRARQLGDPVAAYKVADMYKNGYFVEKNYDKYKEIIEDLYPKVRRARFLGDPLPEVFTRLAKIRSEEGKTQEALQLYDVTRDFLAQRIRLNPFFGNLNIMKWMIEDIYKLRPFRKDIFDLYDLYYLLTAPVKVRFSCYGEEHEVEGIQEDGGIVVRFDEKWFRTVDDFFQKAERDGELLTSIYEDMYDFEVL